MDEELDQLLDSGLLRVPDDFTHVVMQEIRLLALGKNLPESLPEDLSEDLGTAPPFVLRRMSLLKKLQGLALIAGGLLSLAQVVAFMFGVWMTSAAG